MSDTSFAIIIHATSSLVNCVLHPCFWISIPSAHHLRFPSSFTLQTLLVPQKCGTRSFSRLSFPAAFTNTTQAPAAQVLSSCLLPRFFINQSAPTVSPCGGIVIVPCAMSRNQHSESVQRSFLVRLFFLACRDVYLQHFFIFFLLGFFCRFATSNAAMNSTRETPY